MAEPISGKSAEGQLPDLGPFFELSSELMAVVSRDDPVWLRINPAFQHTLGCPEEALIGEPVGRLVRDADQALFRQALETADRSAPPIDLHFMNAQGGFEAIACRFAPAATPRLLLFVGRQAPLPDGARMQARIHRLTSEIEHRVRNNLAVLRSIIRRTAKSMSGSEAFDHLQGRIDAFARIQSKLRLAGDDYRGIDLALLVEDELLAQSIREGDQLRIEGPELALKPRAAEAVGLAIHELAVNAIKFGAFCVKDAAVAVRWEVENEAESRLLLTWSESGVALNSAPVRGDGFGMETLLRSLPYDLGAETELEFAADGIRFSLSVPLEEVVAPSPGG